MPVPKFGSGTVLALLQKVTRLGVVLRYWGATANDNLLYRSYVLAQYWYHVLFKNSYFNMKSCRIFTCLGKLKWHFLITIHEKTFLFDRSNNFFFQESSSRNKLSTSLSQLDSIITNLLSTKGNYNQL